MAKKQENPNFKKSYTKMTPEELALWLHANRKAQAQPQAQRKRGLLSPLFARRRLPGRLAPFSRIVPPFSIS